MVRNEALGIPDLDSVAHPAIVTSEEPELRVIPGSSTHKFGIECRVETFTNDDLDPRREGRFFKYPTNFDVLRTVPLQSAKQLESYLGTLNAAATERLKAALAIGW
jgi:hypothetical protein